MKLVAIFAFVTLGLCAYVYNQWPEPVEEILVPIGPFARRVVITEDGGYYADLNLTNVTIDLRASNCVFSNVNFLLTRNPPLGHFSLVRYPATNNLFTHCTFHSDWWVIER